jgi:hypothetical protein
LDFVSTLVAREVLIGFERVAGGQLGQAASSDSWGGDPLERQVSTNQVLTMLQAGAGFAQFRHLKPIHVKWKMRRNGALFVPACSVAQYAQFKCLQFREIDGCIHGCCWPLRRCC